jgi:hypothetical protein
MAIVRLEGLGQLKKSTSSGFEPATFRLIKTNPSSRRSGGSMKRKVVVLEVNKYIYMGPSTTDDRVDSIKLLLCSAFFKVLSSGGIVNARKQNTG